MKTIKAFTLIELLVAMAVSSIVITAGYASYHMISRHYTDLKNHFYKFNQAAVLKGVLDNDIHNSSRVQKKSFNEFIILKQDTIIQYQWNDNSLTRVTPTSTDTFYITPKNLYMSFAGKEQNNNGLVDELMLEISIEEQSVTYYFVKKYNADILIANEQI